MYVNSLYQVSITTDFCYPLDSQYIYNNLLQLLLELSTCQRSLGANCHDDYSITPPRRSRNWSRLSRNMAHMHQYR